METPEEVAAAAQIVKGKRTKRQRVESPMPLALTNNSSSGDDCINVKNSPSWSPTSSNNEFLDSTEEEDMANCLILLAQGRSRDASRQADDNDTGVYYNRNNIDNNKHNSHIKFNSRRFLETASNTGSGKVGYYVYECKTCNRTFPSFQALGGHRASHKKPKAATATARNDARRHLMMMMMNSSSDEEEGNYKNISSLSLQLSNDNNRGVCSKQSKAKIHECSICGAEFTSGQALGGHMRRHRAPVGAGSSTALSFTPMAAEYVEEAKKARNTDNNNNNNNNVISLDLDLNLPAPEDDKFSFASKQQHQKPQQQQQQQQQQEQEKLPLVFSSRALVDCHY